MKQKQTAKVVIKMSSVEGAEAVKNKILEQFPILTGMVEVVKDPEIKPLNEVIKDLNGGK